LRARVRSEKVQRKQFYFEDKMCFKVKCSKCQKTTWKGCGLHAEAVMRDVPEADRCTCPRDASNN